MSEREGTTKGGEKIKLSVDEEEQSFYVVWYGLCGYYSVEFPFDHEGQAILFYEASLSVGEYEAD